MAFPAQSTALSGEPRSFWFVHMENGQNVCGTNGYSFLAHVQGAIREQLAASGPLPSFGGSIRSEDIASIDTPVFGEYNVILQPQSNRGWDVITLRGLYALARRYNVSRQALAQVEADSHLPVGRPLSPQTIQLAAWIAYYSHADETVRAPDGTLTTRDRWGVGSPSQVAFATHPPTIYPTMGMPPLPTDGVVDSGPVCFPPSVAVPTESPIVITTSFTPNVPLIVATLAAAVIGAAILTKRAPLLVQIRGRR
jgi:hypothetical protein